MADTKVTDGAKSPTLSPPEASVGLTETETEQARPRDLSEAELSITSTQALDEPSLSPPEIQGAQASEGITAWQSDKRIGALWTINQIRNSWVYVNGVGWRMLVNNSDSAVQALSMISAHAKQLTSRVDYREEADGMVYEIYAW
jgi:hypothetical protein